MARTTEHLRILPAFAGALAVYGLAFAGGVEGEPVPWNGRKASAACTDEFDFACGEEFAGSTEAAMAETWRPGLRVRLVGLQARPELNGLAGTLVSRDAATGRWAVALVDGSGTKRIKRANLEVATAAAEQR